MRIHAHFAFKRLTAVVALLLLSACDTPPKAVPPAPSLVAAGPLVAVVASAAPVVKPAEAALAQGLKAYQAAQYTIAETQFNTALQTGLTAPADAATAHKHLAFIYCTSRREIACAKAFKAARAADPGFALTKAEAGHPMWGPVYRKALPTTKPTNPRAQKGAVKPRS
ncbi:TssQ family T6SS-associated lipoprotein [Aquabacterium sp.]|uniref:TssQ family T6SS-associated lipoprotein n=1 Tax=Aquabacterium sp. TaxID=1872578 RepID=UPI0024889D5C|nr:TssQ family T6SS-associated lipoprotein [Aquabacterium sp.]MDI1259800.1 TssQ family T6SS-associated lipoprotein [Aquabacterium sp.]